MLFAERQTTREIPLVRRAGRGSTEHFLHFFFGYLLPALSLMRRPPAGTRTLGRRYLFQSCGPTMDGVIERAMAPLGVEFQILPKDDPRFRTLDAEIVTRWDEILIEKPPSWQVEKAETDQRGWVERNAQWRATLPPDFVEQVSELRHFLIELGHARAGDKAALYADKVLLIRRSPEPEFYKEAAGLAEISGYGAGRRALADIDALCETLRAQGVDAQVFEPGAADIYEQILAFSLCRCVVALRGAELGHLAWMKRRSIAVVLLTQDMDKLTPLHRRLAALSGIILKNLALSGPGPNHSVAADDLLPLLGRGA